MGAGDTDATERASWGGRAGRVRRLSGPPNGSPEEWAEWAAADPTRPRLPAAPRPDLTRPRLPSAAQRDDWRARVRRLARAHGLPALLVTALTLAAQVILFATRPAINALSSDSHQYLARAASILNHGPLTNPARPPGYPLFLDAIFLATGRQSLDAVVAAQVLISVITVYEIYLLVWWIARRAWLAAAIAALIGVNVYILDWQFSIRDETLSTCLLVTLFLVFARLAALPAARWRWMTPAWFALVSVALIFTRPIFVFAPAALVIGLIALWRWNRVDWRRRAAALALSGALVYACVAGYMVANKVQNGYFGLSYTGSLNLFGKLIEYHMSDLPVSPQYQPLQRDVAEFERNGGYVYPGAFFQRYDYSAHNYATLTGYTSYIIVRHPGAYALATLRDIPNAALPSPLLYAQGQASSVFTLLRLVARLSLLSYALPPLLALWLAFRLWRDRSNTALWMLASLLLVVAATIIVSATASYGEFYRLRSPVDPLYLAGAALTVWDIARVLAQRFAPSPPDGAKPHQ